MPRWSWRRTTPSADALPDATLMEQVVAGDGDAFAHLLTRHERTLFNYLLRMTQDEALTADLMQTLQAIGDLLGIGRERVRQLEEQALEKLRQPEQRALLTDFAVV